MFSLELYLRNSEGGNVIYTVRDLYFKDFHIGRKRDDRNLLIIRKQTEGSILIKNPLDFAAVEDYLYSIQDGYLTIDSILYQCQVKFIEPNFTTSQVRIELILLDDYSKMFDGAVWDSWQQNQEPTITKVIKVNDFQSIPDTNFVDGSQYMYDAEAPGSELWGTESIIAEGAKDVYVEDVLLFNIGGDSSGGDPLTIDMLLLEVEYLDQYYKPYFVKYSDKNIDIYEYVYCQYRREFRYFEESEAVPDEGWESVLGTLDKNGFTYNKYVRPLFGDQTYFSGEDIYFIRYEIGGLPTYTTVEFRGINTELQKSDKFYNVNELLEQLIGSANFALTDFSTVIPSDYYVCILKNYNDFQISDRYILEPFINFLRDKFRIYFLYNNDTYSSEFKYLDFPDKLLDIDNYRSTDFIPNIAVKLNDVPKVVDLTTNAWQLDFKSQKITFYGKNSLIDSKPYNISTDLEDTSKSEDSYIIIKTKDDFHNQIYEKFILIGDQNGTEALSRLADGQFISWDTADLDLATYLEFNAYSNIIYLDINDDIQLSYGVIIYDGSVRVRIGNYDVTHTASTTVNELRDSNGATEERVIINLNSGVSTYRGFIYNLNVKVKTKIPEATTGEVSGRSLKNVALSAANTLVSNKPLLSYPKGWLKNKGIIDCNSSYSKEINFNIALNLSLFDWDFNQYCELDSEKYIIFEEMRQVLTDENTSISKISKFSKIIARSDEIY